MTTKNDFLQYIGTFLDGYFKDASEIIAFEEDFCKKIGIDITSQDYSKLKRFFSTATRHLKDIDISAFSQTFNMLYQDILSLFDFQAKFAMKNTLVSQICENNFLTDTKIGHLTMQEKKEISTLFHSEFTKKRDAISKKLLSLANSKMFLLDKLFWYEASKSDKIKAFFEDSMIDGYYDSTTLIKYYIRTMDMGQTQKEERSAYLKDALKVVR